MERLRVVTLNLWGDHAPLARRLDAAAGALAALSVDAVFLQEVRVGDGLANTADELARRLGTPYAATYASATRGDAGTFGPGSSAGEEGLAIVSRLPLTDVASLELPEARSTERRILLSARLAEGGPPVYLHTTHLHWRMADGVARERQVVAIDEALRALPEGSLHVLAGDFNAAPDTDEIRFLCGKHTLSGRRTYYQDAFARMRYDSPGWTWASANPATKLLGWLEPDRRVDYVFVSCERADGRGRVESCRMVLDVPAADGTWPSDHFAVLADVHL